MRTSTILVLLLALTINSAAECKPLPYTYEEVTTTVIYNNVRYTVKKKDVKATIYTAYYDGLDSLQLLLNDLATINTSSSKEGQIISFVKDGFTIIDKVHYTHATTNEVCNENN